MQRQGNPSNANRGTIYFDRGSNSINIRFDQNNVVPVDDSLHDGHPIRAMNNQSPVQFQGNMAQDGLSSNMMDESSSCLNIQNPVRFLDLNTRYPVRFTDLLAEDEIEQSSSSLDTQSPFRFQNVLAEDGLPLPPNATTVQSLERSSGPVINPFAWSINQGVVNSQQRRRQDGLTPLPENTDLNVTYVGHEIGARLNVATEENEDGEGCSSVSRRLSCKRRAPEDASGQPSFSERSTLPPLVNSNQENVGRRLNLPTPVDAHANVRTPEQMVSLGSTFVMHQPSCVMGSVFGSGATSSIHPALGFQAEPAPYQRNIRLRRTINQQDVFPTNMMERTARSSHAHTVGQPGVLFPLHYDLNTSSAMGMLQPAHQMQQPFHVPYSSETLQPFQWNGIARSRIGLPSMHAYGVNEAGALLLENNLRNNLRNGMLPPEFQGRNLEHMLTDLNAVPRTNSSRNVDSTSRISTSQMDRVPVSVLVPQGNMAQQHAHRISDITNRHGGIHWGISFAGHRELSGTVGNASFPNMSHLSELTTWLERQTEPRPEVALNPLAAARRTRNRLLSEVRDIVGRLRRGGPLLLDDVIFIGRATSLELDDPDMHEDMRLDVDNMSYEELLALEEQIGNVSIGISEEVIQEHLKQQKYEAAEDESSSEVEPCCICRDDYVPGENLGKLECGHDFHFDCIKHWLIRKNECPICKMQGLKV